MVYSINLLTKFLLDIYRRYIGENSAYHHGEASLHTTIINMAQSFVGSNNINLLTPSGQFGKSFGEDVSE